MAFPTDQELEAKYKDTFGNKSIKAVSCWDEPNADEPCDDEKYLARAEAQSEGLNKLFEETIANIQA